MKFVAFILAKEAVTHCIFINIVAFISGNDKCRPLSGVSNFGLELFQPVGVAFGRSECSFVGRHRQVFSSIASASGWRNWLVISYVRRGNSKRHVNHHAKFTR
ncbi:hypothetical protein [Methylobacter sp. YRD-M1]|uniref:hypothetical protein n=1 Tax=Methylobacter sp. YRD-M1 TaxID=2911520 RepID=UPI00227B6501|nr:hypothetical protein [Methylobacter sp. YRD-M1]WAK04472.1 hypothetical protein LZ558_21040 [Methylobacter sp. YRD-M1]